MIARRRSGSRSLADPAARALLTALGLVAVLVSAPGTAAGAAAAPGAGRPSPVSAGENDDARAQAGGNALCPVASQLAAETEEDGTIASGGGSAASDDEPDRASQESPGASATPKGRYLLDRLSAGASLGYFNSDRTEVLSALYLDFPFLVIRQKSIYVRGWLETVTVKTGEPLGTDAFRAQNVEYLIEGGVRDYLSNRVAIAAFLGLMGQHRLDGSPTPLPGDAGSVNYVGFGFESAGFPRPGGPDRFEWRIAVGPTFNEEDVESDFILRGAVLYDIWRGRKSTVGIEGSFDSLFDGLSGQTEYRIGPNWSIPMANGVRSVFFADWIRGHNPLLLYGEEGWNFGFRYIEGAYAGPHTRTLPDVRGILTYGRGGSQGYGRFDVDLSSPEIHLFGQPGRVFGNLDADLQAGAGADTLYYVATVGVEITVLPRTLAGASLYHRSNHTVGGEPTEPTNLNVASLYLRTAGWEYADRIPGKLMPGPDARWYDRIEGLFAPGVVTGSNFTDAQAWDLKAGARYDFTPRVRKVVPFARVFGEWGQVKRREASLGVAVAESIILSLQYRYDSELFSEDKSNVFLSGSLYF